MKSISCLLVVLFVIAPVAVQAGEPIFIPVKIDGPAHDPAADAQALKEAVSIGLPVIGLCDANNETKNVDFIIPANNKGRRSLAVVYWLITRETLKERGDISSYDEFNTPIEDFEAKL